MYITKEEFNKLSVKDIMELMQSYNEIYGEKFEVTPYQLKIYTGLVYEGKEISNDMPIGSIDTPWNRDFIRLQLMTNEESTQELINEGIVRVEGDTLIF